MRGTASSLRDWRVVGIEVSSRDHYEWQPYASSDVEHVTLFDQAAYESLASRQIAAQVRRSLNAIEPDAVAVNGWSVPEALAAIDWCRHTGCPAILMSESHEPSARWKEWVKRRRVRRCNAALVGGVWHKEYLESLGFPRDRIFLGYDAVDNCYFAAQAAAARGARCEIQTQLNLPDCYFFVNTRFLARKNVDGLLRSYAEYRMGCGPKSWDLVICGSGEMESAWKSLASQLGLEKCVYWPGFVQYDLLPKYYALASAFVHPAHREAWGLVVNEAASCGLPLIVGQNVGASCELVRNGQNGYLVDTNSQEALLAALTRMTLLSNEERSTLAKCSSEIATAYGPERFGKGMKQALGAVESLAS
jgi:glycosyltransferase involved in cell wall biosynthesis